MEHEKLFRRLIEAPQDEQSWREASGIDEYKREFHQYTTDCQLCEGSGVIYRQGRGYPCPNCGGGGWQSSVLPRELRE